jgi:hypothetical protein
MLCTSPVSSHLVASCSSWPCTCREPRGNGVREGDGCSAQHKVACGAATYMHTSHSCQSLAMPQHNSHRLKAPEFAYPLTACCAAMMVEQQPPSCQASLQTVCSALPVKGTGFRQYRTLPVTCHLTAGVQQATTHCANLWHWCTLYSAPELCDCANLWRCVAALTGWCEELAH